MKKIIRKILKEDRKQMFLDKIVKVIKNDYPLFKNMKDYGFAEQLSDDEYRYIMNKIFGEPVKRSGYDLFNKNGLKIYEEDSKGRWYKTDYIYDFNQKTFESITMDKHGLYERIMYDVNGNVLYEESYDGWWIKFEYDENGNKIYEGTSEGFWDKWEYDERGNVIYYENFEGDWKKSKFDDNGNLLYEENSEGWWVKREYDENGRIIYYEDSTGLKTDNR
jgi:YD repeat-containing protein